MWMRLESIDYRTDADTNTLEVERRTIVEGEIYRLLDALDLMQGFLQGCGFVLDGDLDVVDNDEDGSGCAWHAARIRELEEQVESMLRSCTCARCTGVDLEPHDEDELDSQCACEYDEASGP